MRTRPWAGYRIVASVALIAVVTLTGCTSNSVGVPPSPSATRDSGGSTAAAVPTNVWVQQYVSAGDEAVRWGDSIPPRIILTTYGSGICPTVPLTLEVVDESTLAVTLEPPSTDSCTDDLKPAVFAAERPAGLDLTTEITLTVDGSAYGTLPPLEG
jgi:hypothetical protein